MWKKWDDLKLIIQNKKIIFWGRGEWVEKTLPFADFKVVFIVDNNKNEQGTIEHGCRVVGPEKLKEIFPNKDYYIVITTTDFYNVAEQLQTYGFTPNEDFCVTPALLNNKILSDIRSYSKKIIFSSSDPCLEESSRGGGIYVYDTKNFSYEKKISGVTQGFGMIGEDYYIIDDNEGIRIFDKKLQKQQDCIELPKKSRPHGMAVEKKTGHVYVAFSTMDRVGVYDVKQMKMVREISISHKYKRTGKAWHHINDLYVFEDSLYISMFSFSGNWKKGVFDGGILEYDLKEDRMLGPVVSDLWMPHNVKIIDGMLCYLDSMRGNFHITTHKIASHFNGFIRGLAFDGQFYIIGQSVHRYFDRMKEFSNNIALDCGFFVFDNENKGCRFYSIPSMLDIHTVDIFEEN